MRKYNITTHHHYHPPTKKNLNFFPASTSGPISPTAANRARARRAPPATCDGTEVASSGLYIRNPLEVDIMNIPLIFYCLEVMMTDQIMTPHVIENAQIHTSKRFLSLSLATLDGSRLNFAHTRTLLVHISTAFTTPHQFRTKTDDFFRKN